MLIDWNLNIVKMVIFPKVNYGFNVIPIKIPAGFLAEIDRMILKFIWKYNGTRVSKEHLEKEKVGELTFPDFKTYFKTKVIKIVCTVCWGNGQNR